jgi:hypothetical protein
MAHQETELKDMTIQLQDGTRISVLRDDQDRLVSTGFEPAGKHVGRTLSNGLAIVGFGAWPTWSQNVAQRVATRPDEESGLFEPERLFVLREQYVFFADPASGHEVSAAQAGKPLSFGPIHKVWWAGTENVVQATKGGWH